MTHLTIDEINKNRQEAREVFQLSINDKVFDKSVFVENASAFFKTLTRKWQGQEDFFGGPLTKEEHIKVIETRFNIRLKGRLKLVNSTTGTVLLESNI